MGRKYQEFMFPHRKQSLDKVEVWIAFLTQLAPLRSSAVSTATSLDLQIGSKAIQTDRKLDFLAAEKQDF